MPACHVCGAPVVNAGPHDVPTTHCEVHQGRHHPEGMPVGSIAILRTCARCGADFIARHQAAQYCGIECFVSVHKLTHHR